jgi:hypothetical protein
MKVLLIVIALLLGGVLFGPSILAAADSPAARTQAASGGATMIVHTTGHMATTNVAAAQNTVASNAACMAGTTPILIDNEMHCKVVHPTVPCTKDPGSILIHDLGKPEMCAKGVFGQVNPGNQPGGNQTTTPNVQINATFDDLASATDNGQFDGSSDMSQPADTSSQDDNAIENPQDPTQIGKPSCPDGFTLTTLNGSLTCKGQPVKVCDKEVLRHLMPVAAVNKHWDPQACHWNYQLAN